MDTTKQITRRTATGLLLAGATLPATKAFATHHRGQDAWASIDANGTVVMATISGGSVTAAFDSELQIGSRGGARGFMSFGFGDENVDYVAKLGGLDFDEAGIPNRAWFLMLLRGSDGGVAQDFALGSVDLDASEPCRIYDILGTQVNVEPVRFDVPGRVEFLR
jgi:hypothetical protein